jgi:prephenate dehydratase
MKTLHVDAAYQGAPGAFSEDAAVAMLGPEAQLRPCPTLADVFAALAEGGANAAVVPIENTLAGAVPGAADMIATHAVHIVAEYAAPVAHAVIGVPGATLDGIRRVWSHPVALAQCERWFRDHPHIAPCPAFDTAGAVADVIGRGLTDDAAIGSRRAAEVYGGIVLQADVQDEADNFTRFVLIEPGRLLRRRQAGWKTSLVCVLPNEPGALARALQPFAKRGLNLTRIESRPIRDAPFEYRFHIDVGPTDDPRKAVAAVSELRGCSRAVRVLGVYPAIMGS